MKLIKNNILGFILGGLIFGSVGVYALIQASAIQYKDKTVDAALNELYNTYPKKVCKLIEGTMGEVGSKYECDPGDGEKRNFFLLANNPGDVELIMEHNITEGSSKTTMTWKDAMKYIKDSNLKTTWKNVLDVNLPSAQTIANAVGNTGWNMEEKNYDGWFYFDKNSSGSYGQEEVAKTAGASEYKWLYNYTRECAAYGCDANTSLGTTEANAYWTRDVVAVQKDTKGRAWSVTKNGRVTNNVLTNDTGYGVRPVITLLKSNLYE